MCLLMVSLPGARPTRKELENACFNNSDGFGYSVHHGDHIVSGRGMHDYITIDRFLQELDDNPNAIGMFHARLTTHGSTTIENCHPFRVGGRKDIVLGHNGILPVDLQKTDKRSDTRVFAEDLLPFAGVHNLDDPKYVKELEKWMGGSKIAVLSTAPELKDEVYILNEHLGHWSGGLWWSNASYADRYYYGGGTQWYAPKISGVWTDEPEIDDPYADENPMPGEFCKYCMSQLFYADFFEGACRVCDTCVDCDEQMSLCLCYSPEKYKTAEPASSWKF